MQNESIASSNSVPMYPVALIKSAVETQERISERVLRIPLPILIPIAAHRTQIVLKSGRNKRAVRRVEQTRENVSKPPILLQNPASTILSE